MGTIDEPRVPRPPVHAVQEQLPLDEPVPFRLTTAGRRVVAPDELPELRVVEDVTASPVAVRSRAAHTDLDDDPATRARARAMRRAGMHTLDIAAELEVDPAHVEVWVGDLDVPVSGRGGTPRRLHVVASSTDRSAALDTRARTDWAQARLDGSEDAAARLAVEPELVRGLAVVAGLVRPDPHALLLESDHTMLLRAAWAWLHRTLDVSAAGARVVVRHDPSLPGDAVAHDIAAAFGVDIAHIATSRDPQRVGAGPWIRLRVADSRLSGTVAGWCDVLLADVDPGTETRSPGQ